MNRIERSKSILRLAPLCALAVALSGCRRADGPEGGKPLLCYVGGTMRPAMEAFAKQYEEQTGKGIEIDYAGSGTLLLKIQESRVGDLYVCHDPFLGRLMAKRRSLRPLTFLGLPFSTAIMGLM